MTRPLAAAMFSVALASTAAAQGEPDQRPLPKPLRTLGVDYGYANYQGDIDAWHLASISIGDRRAWGAVAGRLNLARRFATNGAQAEVDAYRSLGKRAYGYLNAGYSRTAVFPDWRWGGEYFRSLPRAYEASLGVRRLHFGGPPVTLFTGAVGRYTGNYWLSLRPFVRDKSSGVSAAASLTARRYRQDPDNYVGARIGYGSSPSDDIIASQLTRTSSMQVALNGSGAASTRAVTTWSLGFEREELSPSEFRNRWGFGVGAKLRF
jgi:YaiO family outer membrane protein